MKIKGEVIEIGTYNEGWFKLLTENGDTYTCYVANMNNWDILYDYMGCRKLECTAIGFNDYKCRVKL